MDARRHLAVCAFILAAVVGVVYFFTDPAAYVWMPKCPVVMMTGWECPSCGAQRALHAALHLRLGEAVAFNPFLVVALPYLGLAVYAFWLDGPGGGWMRRWLFGRMAGWCYVALWCVWGVVRNLM